LLCDPERFLGEKEIMNVVGMGVFYINDHNVCVIRKSINPKLIDIYTQHHIELNQLTKKLLKKSNKVLIIDLHSYSKDPLKYELNFPIKKRPEICIGINEKFDKEIVDKIISIISNFSLEYEINQPFSGCLIPSDYINDDRVTGVMLEIRKDVYEGDGFNKIKDLIYTIQKEV
jgi:predicted N-formylglutamate amidohydrolase